MVYFQLQQYLPFTVLKHNGCHAFGVTRDVVATVLTACGIETFMQFVVVVVVQGCNSTYLYDIE